MFLEYDAMRFAIRLRSGQAYCRPTLQHDKVDRFIYTDRKNQGQEAVMISGEQIQQAVERLVVAAKPSKIILFGSYARGDATDRI